MNLENEKMKKTTGITSSDTNSRVAELIAKSPLPTEQTQRTVEFVTKPVAQIRNNQIVAGIAGTAGLVMFALGIENFIVSIPGLSTPWVEVTLGLILLSTSGLLLKKLN